MNKYFWAILVISWIIQPVSGQRSYETTGGIFFDMFFTARGMGGGLNYSFGEDRKHYLISLDFHSTRDLHESPVNPAYGRELGRKYVYGKLNYFYVLTPSFGISYNLIPKNGMNYANLRGMIKAGPAIGLLNPYYLEVYKPNQGPGTDNRVIEAYDPSAHSYNRIFGRARLFSSGFDLNARVGLSIKTMALLDFAPNPRFIHGLSLGLNTDLFFHPVPIMAELDKLQNQRIFVVGSLGFIIGNRW